jgi:hypothetical protein
MGINHEGNDLLLLVSTYERSIIIIVVIDVSLDLNGIFDTYYTADVNFSIIINTY